METIDWGAFRGSRYVTDIYCNAPAIPAATNSAFGSSGTGYTGDKTRPNTLHVPASLVDGYNATTSIVENNVNWRTLLTSNKGGFVVVGDYK